MLLVYVARSAFLPAVCLCRFPAVLSLIVFHLRRLFVMHSLSCEVSDDVIARDSTRRRAYRPDIARTDGRTKQ